MPTVPGYPLMHGAQFAKQYVNNYLSEDIPVRIIDYRNGWNVDDITLPTPEGFTIYEPFAIDTWPLVITVVMSSSSFNRIGFDGPDPLYRVSYSMRTYVWVRTEGSEECTIMRDRLTTVLRSALLDYPCLKAYDERASFRVIIDEGSLREEFSDLTLLKGDRIMAGAYISYNMEIDEVVSRKPIGTVSSIDLEIDGSGALSAPLPIL
jgi:hypothetical protein